MAQTVSSTRSNLQCWRESETSSIQTSKVWPGPILNSPLKSWLGVIAGGPTFLGTVVGQAWTSTAVSVLFLTLAAGSILYVVTELLNVCRLFTSKTVTDWGLLLGLTLGFATDFVLVAAGV